MAIRDELLDELMKGYEKPEDLIGENGLLKDLTKRLLEKALQGEMTHHYYFKLTHYPRMCVDLFDVFRQEPLSFWGSNLMVRLVFFTDSLAMLE